MLTRLRLGGSKQPPRQGPQQGAAVGGKPGGKRTQAQGKAGLGLCWEAMEQATKVLATVGALVFNAQGEALFVRTFKWGGRWGVPGGKIDPGEGMEAALLREFREETGLHLDQVRFLLVQEAVNDPEFHKPAHLILLNFTAQVVGGELLLNEEAEEARWLLPEAALAELNLGRVTRVLVEAHLAREATEGTHPQGQP